MEGARTRGHGSALASVAAMIRDRPPHALLLTGPAGVGKTTLALDLAAGLMCCAPDPLDRPCRACRGCLAVSQGSHPDLHWLAPEGPGGQIGIGGPKAKYRGVRELIADLALLPLEGGARIAIVEPAQRMTEDAQTALLKTLEEPPAGLTIILCADDDSRLLPTVRSRCARLRLGPVGTREIETILAERGGVDAPTAASLARMAGGRPGLALAYALAPDAPGRHRELDRVFIDLARMRPSARLASLRAAIPVATALATDLEAGALAASRQPGAEAAPDPPRKRRRSTREADARATDRDAPTPASADDAIDETDSDADKPARGPAPAQRRRAAETLIGVALGVARDLALATAGATRSLRATDLLEELDVVASAITPDAAVDALRRAERAAELVAANVNPELVLDDLVLAWPRSGRAA